MPGKQKAQQVRDSVPAVSAVWKPPKVDNAGNVAKRPSPRSMAEVAMAQLMANTHTPSSGSRDKPPGSQAHGGKSGGTKGSGGKIGFGSEMPPVDTIPPGRGKEKKGKKPLPNDRSRSQPRGNSWNFIERRENYYNGRDQTASNISHADNETGLVFGVGNAGQFAKCRLVEPGVKISPLDSNVSRQKGASSLPLAGQALLQGNDAIDEGGAPLRPTPQEAAAPANAQVWGAFKGLVENFEECRGQVGYLIDCRQSDSKRIAELERMVLRTQARNTELEDFINDRHEIYKEKFLDGASQVDPNYVCSPTAKASVDGSTEPQIPPNPFIKRIMIHGSLQIFTEKAWALRRETEKQLGKVTTLETSEQICRDRAWWMEQGFDATYEELTSVDGSINSGKCETVQCWGCAHAKVVMGHQLINYYEVIARRAKHWKHFALNNAGAVPQWICEDVGGEQSPPSGMKLVADDLQSYRRWQWTATERQVMEPIGNRRKAIQHIDCILLGCECVVTEAAQQSCVLAGLRNCSTESLSTLTRFLDSIWACVPCYKMRNLRGCRMLKIIRHHLQQEERAAVQVRAYQRTNAAAEASLVRPHWMERMRNALGRCEEWMGGRPCEECDRQDLGCATVYTVLRYGRQPAAFEQVVPNRKLLAERTPCVLPGCGTCRAIPGMPLCKMVDAIKVGASPDILGAVSPNNNARLERQYDKAQHEDYKRLKALQEAGLMDTGRPVDVERASIDGTEWHMDAAEEAVRQQQMRDFEEIQNTLQAGIAEGKVPHGKQPMQPEKALPQRAKARSPAYRGMFSMEGPARQPGDGAPRRKSSGIFSNSS